MLADFNWMDAMKNSPIFLALILCSIATLGIALERIHYFWKRNSDPDVAATRAMKKIEAGQISEALWECESSPHPMGAIAAEVFRNITRSYETMEERMQIALSRQKLLLERNLNVLGTMAAIAPLVGLLGTVWGIMRAFYDMAQTGSAAPSVVAGGVAEALITTAAGLIVAVPALMLYNHFTRRMNVMLTEAENHARHIRTALVDNGVLDADTTPGDDTTGGDAERTVEATTTGPMTPQPAGTR